MTDLFRFLIIYAAQSAGIYAVAASGLVVTYATSGIFNFAHGAVGMIAAFTYWELWQNRGWPGWLALIVVLFVEAPIIGLLLDRLIMRRLRDASTITTIVVTIGLLVALLQVAGIIWPQGQDIRTLPQFFDGHSVKLLGVNVPYHAFIVLACAAAVAVGLRVLLYDTRIGCAMRAVVDDPELGALNGVDPGRVSSASWMLGSMLASLAGVLLAPILPQFTPVALTLLVISAYAAAMVGRLRSLPLTFLGALVLAELENILLFIDTKNIGGKTLADLAGHLNASAPVLLLFLVLIFLPQDRLHFGVVRRQIVPRPSMRTMVTAMGAYLVVAFVVVHSGWVSDNTLNEVGKGVALGIVMLSLVLLTGYAGQVSLAQLGFAGIGAVVVWKLGPVVGLAGGIALAAVVGALVALPALRMRDLYLALTTMAFALLLEQNIYGDDAVFSQLLPFSLGNATAKRFPGFTSTTGSFMLMAIAFAGVALLLTYIRNGAYGRRLAAMKDSPAACATLGLDLTVTKLQTFALAAGIAGLGGAMLAMWKSSSVGRTDFSLLEGPLPGLPLVLVAVVFGITSVGGIVFGSLAFVMMPVLGGWHKVLRNVVNLAPGVAGVGLGQNPDGAAGQVVAGVEEARSGREGERPAAARPAPVTPELVGVGSTATPEDIAALDDALGLTWGVHRG